MSDQKTGIEFQQSFALFDADRRLVEWDSGLLAELPATAQVIGRGTSYADFVRTAYTKPVEGATLARPVHADELEELIGDRVRSFGRDQSMEYHIGSRIILVQQTGTASGGMIRTARDVTAEREIAANLQAAEQKVEREGGEPATIPFEMRRSADGQFSYNKMTPETRRFFGLSPA